MYFLRYCEPFFKSHSRSLTADHKRELLELLPHISIANLENLEKYVTWLQRAYRNQLLDLIKYIQKSEIFYLLKSILNVKTLH